MRLNQVSARLVLKQNETSACERIYLNEYQSISKLI